MNQESAGAIRDKIVLFDDEEANTETWSEELRPLLEEALGADCILRCQNDRLKADLKVLEERRRAARHGRDIEKFEGTVFDHAKILVIDFDLFELDPGIDGEDVAYLARLYSSAGLIVGVNQDPTERWFDLTLRDHLHAFTDVSVSGEHLDTPSLWHKTECEEARYRPWAWPHLLEAADELEHCVRIVSERETEDLCQLLGITEERVYLLGRDARLPIEVVGTKPSKLAEVSQVLRQTAMGLKFSKDVVPEQTGDRTLAARIRKWLEVAVLPRQDILIDGPHLAAAMPGLVEDRSDPERRAVCRLHEPPNAVGLDAHALDEHVGIAGPWLSRATWWWPEVASSATLDQVRNVDSLDDAVFCEDLSRFASAEVAKQFSAGVGGGQSRRWIRYLTDADGNPIVDYEPSGRLVG